MAWAFITQAQATNRLSAQLLKRLTDDDRDGAGDSAVIAQLIADASSKVAGYCQGIHDLSVISEKAGDDTAHEVVRLTLDAFEWMAIKRHPEAARHHDWVELMKANNAELKLLRESFTKLDVEGAPNEPANVGGTLYPEEDSTAASSTFYGGGFGDFG